MPRTIGLSNSNCADKTFLMLNQYVIGNFPQVGSAPAYQLIQQAIQRSWQLRKASIADVFDITTYVATTKSNGSPFIDTTYSAVYKPVYEVIEELSQVQYTGDTRPFIFWMDANNMLHWVYPSQVWNGTINELTCGYLFDEHN